MRGRRECAKMVQSPGIATATGGPPLSHGAATPAAALSEGQSPGTATATGGPMRLPQLRLCPGDKRYSRDTCNA